jgi:hypothetical protein
MARIIAALQAGNLSDYCLRAGTERHAFSRTPLSPPCRPALSLCHPCAKQRQLRQPPRQARSADSIASEGTVLPSRCWQRWNERDGASRPWRLTVLPTSMRHVGAIKMVFDPRRLTQF